MVSWTFSLPNTPLTTSTENLGNGSESGTHFENLDLKLKNVSFHGLEEEEESRVFINVSRNSLNIDKLGLRNSGVLRKDCDIFDGKWVRDDELPHYPPGICPFIDRDFNCHLNGRPDDGYYRWKWQPFGCNIPSIKDKNTVYEVSGKREFKKEGIYAIRFEARYLDYNCTIDYVRAPFLVRESTFQKNNGSLSTLRLDLMDETTQMYHDAHILVFNTGHWWTHEKTSRGEEYYQEGDLVHPRLKALKAYRKALATWGRWVDRHIDYKKTLVFFRGYSGTHFRGGQWNSGGQCHKETEPIFNETYLGKYPSKMRALEQVLGKMKTPVMYLNISRLTDYRKDAHPSIYRKSYESEDERIEAEQSQDCSHWCLPGVPDLWNELLYASLLKVGWGSQSQGT
uniref:Trichome birefringence-like C-terminal domain-containing protein n=1 Tax=Chenopodium quinoa TaxID=63459 RepID=A0A803L0N0_CHEQI